MAVKLLGLQKLFFVNCISGFHRKNRKVAKHLTSLFRECHHVSEINQVRIVEAVPQESSGVNVVYSDGSKNTFRYIWLRDSCSCAECYDEEHLFRRLKTVSLDLEIKPNAMWVTSDGHLGIKWPQSKTSSEHKSVYSSEWLWKYGQCFTDESYSVTRDTSQRPPLELWDAGILDKGELPQMSYDKFYNHPDGLKQWMELFYKYGFVLLTGVPSKKETIEDVAEHISYIRHTSFGKTSDVKLGPNSDSHHQDGGMQLDLHTDLPYREKSPGALMVHCLKAPPPDSANGEDGKFQISDGFFAANWLHDHHLTDFTILSKVPVVYGCRDPSTGVHYTSYWPIIHVDPMWNIEEIHYNTFSRQPLQLPDDQVIPFYRALAMFGQKIDETQISFHLHPSHLLTLNNRRILHSRTVLNPQRIFRHLRTCYLDLDEILFSYDALLSKFPNRSQLNHQT